MRTLPRPVDQRDERIEPAAETARIGDGLETFGEFERIVIRSDAAVEEGDNLFAKRRG
ncbi:MAG TPA: hypothetical protein VKQ27_02605 [Acetobacteraceae bacterium]|nr:hypothetical protein [Acetobacteraceae bacterium]